MRHEMLVAQENLVTDVQFLLQGLMRKNNMSRAELARRSGLSNGLIARVMTPVNEPPHNPDACEPDGRFYVYRTDGKGPKYIHLSYENALQEAKRLARETKDCARFEVLRIVASVETVMQTKVDDYR